MARMTLRSPLAPWAMVLGSLLLVSALALPARAQSDADIRKQNQQLAAKVQDLEKELEALRKDNAQYRQKIADLDQQIAAMRRGGAAAVATQPAALQPEPVSVDESVPTASPRALFNAIVKSYEDAFNGMDLGRPGDAKRKAYLRKLDGWKSLMDRQHRTPITWHVVMVGEQPVTERTRIVKLQAVDPQTGTQLGLPFDVVLSRAGSDHLAAYESRGDMGPMVLRGTAVPSVRVNEQRESRGAFDNPPFIGPFAELTFAVDAKSLLPVKEDQNQEAAGSNPGNGSTPAPAPAAKKPATRPATPEK